MITARVTGTDAVARVIQDFAAGTGRSLTEEIIATARLLSVSLATSTQPYGKTKASKTAGEGAVRKDIAKLFRTPGSVYQEIKEDDEFAAKQFWSAFKRTDTDAMRSLMTAASIDLEIVSRPSKEVHDAARNARGRVRGRARQLVTAPGAIDAYTALRQKKVGFAKAGWAAAADACGGHRGIPAWASGRHPTAPGGASIIRDPARPQVTIFNHVSYIDQILPSPQIEAAVSIAYDKLLKRLDIITRKTLRLNRAA